MLETRKHTYGEFGFFTSLEEARPYIHTTFNIAEMPLGGYFSYKDNIYRIHHYENNTFEMWVTNPELELRTVPAEDQGLYLGDTPRLPNRENDTLEIPI